MSNEAQVTSAEKRAPSQAILDSLRVQIVVLDTSGTIICVNEAWKRFARENNAGVSVTEGVGLNYFKICREAAAGGDETAQQCLTSLQAVLDGSAAFVEVKYLFDAPENPPRWFLMRAVPLHTQGGGLVISHVDITSRMRETAALRESNERLQATLNALPDAMFEVDRRGRFYDYRVPQPGLLYPPHLKFLGKTVDQVFPEGAASIIMNAIQQASQKGHHFGTAVSLETPAGLSWLDLSIAARGDPQSADGRFIILMRDITRLVQVEERLWRRLETEGALATIATRFMQTIDFEQAVSDTLEDIPRLTGVRQAGLFCLHDEGNRLNKSSEWCADGTSPTASYVQNVATDAFPWLVKKLRTSQLIFIQDFSHLSSEARAEMEALKVLQVGPCVIFPLTADGELVGFIGFDGLSGDGANLDEVMGLLEVVAGIMGGALQRKIVLDTLEQRVTRRTQELALFFDMTMLPGEAAELHEMLELALARIIEISDCHAACIHLLDEDRTSLGLLAQRGMPEGVLQQVQLVRLEADFENWMAGQNPPILVSDETAARQVPAELLLMGHGSYLGAQLRVSGEPRGLLSCFWVPSRYFPLDEVSVLVAVAEQLGAIVENDRLRRQIEEMAVVGERQRLARELHDAVTQSLFSLTLFARSGRQALEDGETERLEDSLRQLEENSQHALKEMRLLLYQLLPAALEREGLVQALNLRLDAVERRLGMEVDYQVEGPLDLPKTMEKQIYRIAIEALNNSLKHAVASRIRVHLRVDSDLVSLEITDNGQGFDTNQVHGGMGLGNMRDRAESLGGWLKVWSATGEGTQVLLSVAR